MKTFGKSLMIQQAFELNFVISLLILRVEKEAFQLETEIMSRVMKASKYIVYLVKGM